MVFKNLCVLVLCTKEASALEGLTPMFKLIQLRKVFFAESTGAVKLWYQCETEYETCARTTPLTLVPLVANLACTKLCERSQKMTETLAHGYSSDSTL